MIPVIFATRALKPLLVVWKSTTVNYLHGLTVQSGATTGPHRPIYIIIISTITGGADWDTVWMSCTVLKIPRSTCQNDGTLTSAYWDSGMFNNALSFDGNDDYVNMGDPADGSLDMGSSDFTLTAWVKINSGYYDGYVIDKGALGGGPGYAMRINRDKKLSGHIQAADGYNQAVILSDALSADVWYHVAVVFDRDNQVYGYINGECTGSGGITGNTGSLDNSRYFYIGRNFSGSTPYFDGIIDEVKLFPAALDFATIQQLYRDGWHPGFFIPLSNPEMLYCIMIFTDTNLLQLF